MPLGALPYENLKSVTAMMAKLFPQIPYIPELPKLSETDKIINRSFCNIPGISVENKKVVITSGNNKFKEGLESLDKAFNNPFFENLDKFSFDAVFLEKYLQIIKKFRSKNACVNLLGPFTISQILNKSAEEQMLADKNYRKLFIQSVCVKALWIIEKIRKYNPDTVPIIILEEPELGGLGDLKRENENITSEVVINMFTRVFDKIKATGAIVGVQCFEKCDWSIPIKAGADLISFDAYSNPANLNIIPEIVSDYLREGGMINWCIVPTTSEHLVKGLTLDNIYKRFSNTVGDLILSGVPGDLLFKAATVSTQDDLYKLPVMFAEKAIMLSTQIGSKLAANRTIID